MLKKPHLFGRQVLLHSTSSGSYDENRDVRIEPFDNRPSPDTKTALICKISELSEIAQTISFVGPAALPS